MMISIIMRSSTVFGELLQIFWGILTAIISFYFHNHTMRWTSKSTLQIKRNEALKRVHTLSNLANDVLAGQPLELTLPTLIPS